MKEKIWSKEELTTFCLEFSMLLKAGMSVGESFLILSENEKAENRKATFYALYEQTILGASVYETMAKAGIFPDYMLKLLEIAEETGHLDEAFTSLSRYYEERVRMASLIKETVTFPIILFVMMLAVVVLLITEVLPVFQNVFAQLGGTLPGMALFFLGIGETLLAGKTVFLALLVILMALVILILCNSKIRNGWTLFWSKSLASTKMGKQNAKAHFASAVYMTVSGGLDTDRSMEMAADFCKDTSLVGNILRCREKMQEGMPFAEAVETEGLLAPMYCRMLAIGVKTGNLDGMLGEIARRSEEEAATAFSKAAARVEPVVVIALSVIVGLLLLSVMFPLVGIMSSLG